MGAASLKDIRILLAESDVNLGILLSQVLQRMGFRKVHLVRDGAAALEHLRAGSVDLMITEWQLPEIDGIKLTQEVRYSENSPNRLLPIIMLTARAEKQDVEAARDIGITEFIVKPYNSNTVYKRIQQVVDNPRAFMLAPEYIGPDRRRRVLGINDEERRVIEPELVDEAPPTPKVETPKLLLPSYSLKKKIGSIDSLDEIITPKIVASAQKEIDALQDESLKWIQEYVRELHSIYGLVEATKRQADIDRLLEVLLKVKSNSGTFGYLTVSKLSQQLYHFMREDYDCNDDNHNQVLMKHIESITLLLSESAAGRVLDKEGWLVQALKTLVNKFSAEAKKA